MTSRCQPFEIRSIGVDGEQSVIPREDQLRAIAGPRGIKAFGDYRERAAVGGDQCDFPGLPRNSDGESDCAAVLAPFRIIHVPNLRGEPNEPGAVPLYDADFVVA